MNTVKHSYSAPTDKQIAYATVLARKAGYRALWAAEREFFGNRVQSPKREAYARFIDFLGAKAN